MAVRSTVRPRRDLLGCILLATIVACGTPIDPPVRDRERYAEMPDLPAPGFWPNAGDSATVDRFVQRIRTTREPFALGDMRFKAVGAEKAGVGAVIAIRPVAKDGSLLEPKEPPKVRYASAPTIAANAMDKDWLAATFGGSREVAWTEPNKPLVGVVIALHGGDSASADCSQALIDAMMDRGFAVLSTTVPTIPDHIEFAATTMDEVTKGAEQLARVVTLAIADQVYAVEGMLEYHSRQHPELKDGSLVLIGVTEGVAIVPALALRLHGHVRGALLVGGGADLFAHDQDRAEGGGNVKVSLEGEASAKDGMRWMHDIYARDSRLDPFAMAVWLRATRTAMVDFEGSSTGDVLFRRLDHPLRTFLGDDRGELLSKVRKNALSVLAFLWDDAAYYTPMAKKPTED